MPRLFKWNAIFELYLKYVGFYFYAEEIIPCVG